jgi:hypothetical protein
VQPDLSADQDDVAGTGPAGPDVDALADEPDAGGVDVDPSPCPASTTLVSPVTRRTPAARAASPRAVATRPRSASAVPSSRMNAVDRYSGSAPDIARSFTVPLTARSPIEPPGKNSGRTT